jgi:hypothetical protein
MTGRRITWAEAERVAERLSPRDWAILRGLAATRVLTGGQLTRLHFHELSAQTRDRVRRRVLERLTQWQIVARLGRAVGGVRAGSCGWVYSLGVAGQRLAQIDARTTDASRVRRPWTPSVLFLTHSLAVAELYVGLVERSRDAAFTVTTFQAEPVCWWPNGLGGFLKPDAFVVLSTVRFDELVWLEVDRGTESLPTLKRKLADYLDFMERGQLGPRDVMPHVVITTSAEARLQAVERLVAGLGPGADEVFSVVGWAAATGSLSRLAQQPEARPP